MNFTDVERDVHKLIGLELNSISRSAAITIENIDDEQERLIIRPKNGNSRSRPMDELKRIWDAMQKEPAVHVDKVLNGSGTSRNQPETILANLPYIEWLRIDNKKHIAYVGESTHPFGTLQEMDPVNAVEIAAKLKASARKANFSSVIVSKDINASISSVQKICSGKLSTVDKGIYQIETKSDLIVFLSAETCGLEEGTYAVIESHAFDARRNGKKAVIIWADVYCSLSWKYKNVSQGILARGTFMADVLTEKQRHYNMSRIRSKNTKPEEVVRKYLFSKGFRYRKNDARYPVTRYSSFQVQNRNIHSWLLLAQHPMQSQQGYPILIVSFGRVNLKKI